MSEGGPEEARGGDAAGWLAGPATGSPLIPERVRTVVMTDPRGPAWLDSVPGLVEELARRWGLSLGRPLDHEGYTSAVVPGETRDGTAVVLKVGFPFMEDRDQAAGLRFWDGDPTVRLLAADEESGALLLERCVPGHSLRTRPAEERDRVLAGLLRRAWRPVGPGHAFRHLSELIDRWSAVTAEEEARWPDPGLVREGIASWRELSRPGPDDVLLVTDAHAGNVLAAEREPWLIIDPRPFVGDRAYDATRHLFDVRERLAADPAGFLRYWADLLGLDVVRVRAWAFARFAAEYSESDEWWRWAAGMARKVAP